METKHKWKSDEPWKQKEPGGRLNAKQRALQSKSDHERAIMEKRSAQNVKVIFKDSLTGLPDVFHKFQIEMEIPLSQKEIMQRVHMAFPELELRQKNGGRS